MVLKGQYFREMTITLSLVQPSPRQSFYNKSIVVSKIKCKSKCMPTLIFPHRVQGTRVLAGMQPVDAFFERARVTCHVFQH